MSYHVGTNDTIFAQDKAFWNGYLKGRAQVPDSFFDRIFRYHQEHGGQFDVAHDVGAGNGPYAQKLRSIFQHVIVSDVAAGNVRLARDRLGENGFSYRVAKVEQADDIPVGSVDMVFATNVMHWVDQSIGPEAIAKQLRPGGTFVCAGFGPARFDDAAVQDVWTRLTQQGGRALLKEANEPEKTLRVMTRSQGLYNVAPLSGDLFAAGVKRIHLNMETGGLTGLVPPEYRDQAAEPDYGKPDDQVIFETDDSWRFETDLDGIKEHFGTFPFATEDPVGFTELWKELEEIIGDCKSIRGCWPAKTILATRR